ncbi:hypothetical protein ADIAL_1996 [Alkalibacterium sp. AK22]|uniref:prepilin-type N-terminal cleavage/methylation domain-containing protein n=1 Tax=Alkalibacterium sp. AK22 TaxID=1229520 RepID=UPI00044D923F|nr:prepilin-type N-terminal cleavage/methylation domain-containing protein [Alkalibacterium sp. AK22]EXJ22410.1 hypothetical protein ADIAL_1996 [Alkalibacterium sp. AK22]
MNRWKKDQGITLIELLASLAILSLVILLIASVHLFGQTQFVDQAQSASQGNNLRYGLSVLSREVRRAETASWDDNKKTLTTDNDIFIWSGSRLTKNGEILIEDIGKFDASVDANEGKVDITLAGRESKQGKVKSYSTTIYFRGSAR